jgi:ribonuclease HII
MENLTQKIHEKDTRGKSEDNHNRSQLDTTQRTVQTPGSTVVFIDGNIRPHWAKDNLFTQYVAAEKADKHCVTVATASICAKYLRDRLMVDVYDPPFPMFGLKSHKGYCTADHMNKIIQHGERKSCHRLSYKFIQRKKKQDKCLPSGESETYSSSSERKQTESVEIETEDGCSFSSTVAEKCQQHVRKLSGNTIELIWLT